jgi:hypothetical protein
LIFSSKINHLLNKDSIIRRKEIAQALDVLKSFVQERLLKNTYGHVDLASLFNDD